MNKELAEALPVLPTDFYWKISRGVIKNCYYLTLYKRYTFLGMVWYAKRVAQEHVFLDIGGGTPIQKFVYQAKSMVRRTIESPNINAKYTGKYL